MRDAARGGADVLLLLAIVLAGLLLWTGAPLGSLYLGSLVQAATASTGAALAAAFAGLCVAVFAIVGLLGWLNGKHLELQAARGRRGGSGVLELVMTISAVVAVAAFVLWFFVLEGPGPSIAPQ
jgi:hypothetical protein